MDFVQGLLMVAQLFFVEFLKLALPALASVLVGLVVHYRGQIIAVIKAKLTAPQLAVAKTFVQWAVKAIEQENVKQGLQRSEAEMKAAALLLIKNALNSVGLTILADNEELLATILEAALRDGVHKESGWIVGTAATLEPRETPPVMQPE